MDPRITVGDESDTLGGAWRPSEKKASTENQVVNSHNEWDPLEEVVVGVVEGAADLPWDVALQAVTPESDIEDSKKFCNSRGGKARMKVYLDKAREELAEFIHILEAEGVKVRRPEPIDHAVPHATPLWNCVGGNNQADPRDVLIVVGNEIIEATMSWRSRYFEYLAYRKLLKEYFKQGAKWSAAPKPALTDELYNCDYKRGEEHVLTEFEPVFDAADVARCGRDLFIQKSHVTNDFGIDWFRRHIGDEYKLHKVEFADDRAIHIDATFVPLAPGKVMANPDRPIKHMPEMFKKAGWDVLVPPKSTLSEDYPLYLSFRWLSMNVLNLDEKRVIVEKNEEPMIKALKDWGFEPIPCPFRANYRFGGSFHCATVDIRRRGALQSYF